MGSREKWECWRENDEFAVRGCTVGRTGTTSRPKDVSEVERQLRETTAGDAPDEVQHQVPHPRSHIQNLLEGPVRTIFLHINGRCRWWDVAPTILRDVICDSSESTWGRSSPHGSEQLWHILGSSEDGVLFSKRCLWRSNCAPEMWRKVH